MFLRIKGCRIPSEKKQLLLRVLPVESARRWPFDEPIRELG